jgi:hypothetical protein
MNLGARFKNGGKEGESAGNNGKIRGIERLAGGAGRLVWFQKNLATRGDNKKVCTHPPPNFKTGLTVL